LARAEKPPVFKWRTVRQTPTVPARNKRMPLPGALNYLSDYAQQLQAMGERDFALDYRNAAMIMSGISGKFAGSQRNTGGTMVIDGTASDEDAATMMFGRVFLLRKRTQSDPGAILIGRTADSDVTIPEYTISQRHCAVRVTPSHSTVEDMGSTNGTYVNGERLVPRERAEIANGDSVMIGRFVFTYFTPPGFVEEVQKLL